jgi:mono/diheme cytochrome c family protein
MIRRATLVVIVALVCILITIGCSYTGTITSNTSETTASVNDQLKRGALIYAQTCATSTCHGAQGEGIRSDNSFKAWPLVGAEFQSRHPNAQIVFDVVRSGGERNLLALTDQQIYDAIAYELSQNQIALKSSLTAANAFTTYGGAMSGEVQGGFFPPSDNIVIREMPTTRDLPLTAENDKLRLKIDQIAETSTIGKTNLPVDDVFLIVVFVLTDLDQTPIMVNPDYLRLSTLSNDLLKPQSVNLHSAIEKFHEQTIRPQHGTVGLVVFALTASDQFDQLIYDDGADEQLRLTLKP